MLALNTGFRKANSQALTLFSKPRKKSAASHTGQSDEQLRTPRQKFEPDVLLRGPATYLQSASATSGPLFQNGCRSTSQHVCAFFLLQARAPCEPNSRCKKRNTASRQSLIHGGHMCHLWKAFQHRSRPFNTSIISRNLFWHLAEPPNHPEEPARTYTTCVLSTRVSWSPRLAASPTRPLWKALHREVLL